MSDTIPTGVFPYTRGSILTNGGEGGVGAYDCEPLSFNDNYAEHAWGNYFSISFGPGYMP